MATKRPRLAAGRARALGQPTRGTTNPNRLRRCDRWLLATPAVHAVLRSADAPLVIDLGYGASPVTTVEMAARLSVRHPSVQVLGLELDAERVAAAEAANDPPRLRFARGGFELAGEKPLLLRAFNVLRQYTEPESLVAWEKLIGALPPGGLIVEGTCNEIGRRCTWVTLDANGPRWLTISLDTNDITRPSDVAERLPKSLIHHNVPGENIYELLRELDSCWDACAVYVPFGTRVRWAESVRMLESRGWPLVDRWARWRHGELTVPWATVAPRAP